MKSQNKCIDGLRCRRCKVGLKEKGAYLSGCEKASERTSTHTRILPSKKHRGSSTEKGCMSMPRHHRWIRRKRGGRPKKKKNGWRGQWPRSPWGTYSLALMFGESTPTQRANETLGGVGARLRMKTSGPLPVRQLPHTHTHTRGCAAHARMRVGSTMSQYREVL